MVQDDFGNVVEQPKHYKQWGVETIDFVMHMEFWRGNAIKYLSRAGFKGNEEEDLLKAQQYITFRLNELRGKSKV